MPISYQKQENINLANMLPFESFLGIADLNSLQQSDAVESFPVQYPDEYSFLHEAAVIVWRGIIFCSWYNCPAKELQGFTPIRGKFSKDGGKTWSKVETIAEDPEKKLICCPPVYGICDGELYMLINTMVGADLIHSIEFFKFDPATEKFVFLKSEPIPFKLNTNVYALDNGKLLLPGRIAEMDSFPATPAVLISDSGKIDAPWRLVKIQQDKFLPDGAALVHPELTAIVQKNVITIFSRNDNRNVPLFYRSEDFGENWSGVMAHDIPFTNSKIYSGTLADGRNYLIGNIADPEEAAYSSASRARLALFISEPETLRFTKGILLRDGYDAEQDLYPQWSYPVAYEWENRLYVIYTMSSDGDQSHRGAMLSIVDLQKI
ncbi:MAG: exo-alpha-sialidase [Lentisphaeria bacterium]|nr:exo-alpha-sialidase [Lentisphaeria bacterium]